MFDVMINKNRRIKSMEYLDFVVDNYIWFLVGGIVLLMTLIGYFAEKTQFGKKSSSKKEKMVEKDIPVKSVVIPPTQEDMEETLVEEEPIVTTQREILEEEPMESLDDIEIQEPTATEDWDTDSETTVSEEEIPDELYAGLDGTPNTYKNTEETEELDMELPNIEELKTDIDDTSSDDDIWRF